MATTVWRRKMEGMVWDMEWRERVVDVGDVAGRRERG